jgi:hypothetical protein
MTALARVSPQLSVVAVSALDLSQRAAMAVPRQAMQGRREVHAAAPSIPGRGSTGVRLPGVMSTPVREQRRCDRPWSTEDAAARSVRGARHRGALARGEGAEGKVSDTTPLIANSCGAKRKKHGHRAAR